MPQIAACAPERRLTPGRFSGEVKRLGEARHRHRFLGVDMGSKWKIVWIGTALLGLLASGAGGCGSSGQNNGGCLPGAQTACDCPGGTRGVQVCAADGMSLGTCQCG